jgi:hypothetical protein
MYPERELKRLADRKAVLRMRIGLGRVQCAEAAARVARPLAWLDRAREFLIRIRPLTVVAAVPIALLVRRSASRPLRILGSIARWAPIVLGGLRSSLAAREE